MGIEQISTYGLTEDEFQLVKNSILKSSIEIFQEITPVDAVMRRRIFALVMNLDRSTTNQREFLQGIYEEFIWFPETLIFTGEFRPEWSVTGQIIYTKNLRELEPDLRQILQAAYSKTRNTENFSQGLIRSFQIAREIRNRPGVTTAKLSEDLFLSEHLINWYIILLQSSQELIEYNEETGGWNYFDDGESGSMEQTIRSELANQAMNDELDGWIKYKDNSAQMVEQIKSELNKD